MKTLSFMTEALIIAKGYKDILNITVGVNETSKFRMEMLNDLKKRYIGDVCTIIPKKI